MTRTALYCLLLASAATGGCASLPMTTFRVQEHAVFVDTDGRARQALAPDEIRRRKAPVGVRLTADAGEAQIGQLIARIRASPHDTVLVYVHGGRVHYDKSYARVAERGRLIDSAGYYPVFVNWNGSLGSSLWWHIFRVRQGEDWGPVRGTLSAPFVALAALGRAVTRAPLTTWHQATDLCRTQGGLARGDLNRPPTRARLCRVPGADEALAERIAWERSDGNGPAPASAAATAPLAIGIGSFDLGLGRRALRAGSAVVTLPSKLVLAPVADGFGAGALGDLRRRTTSLVHARNDLAPTWTPQADYEPARGHVHALLDSLHRMIGEQRAESLPPERRRERALILVGHSLGTLVIDEILVHFPTLEVARIIYLAPVTTLAELEDGVLQFLERRPRTTYYHGMLHPYAEAGEWQPGMLDLVPRGSLLEWLDDYLTTPHTPLDRVSGKWSNLVTATHIFRPAVRDRVVIKAFGVGDPLDAWSPVLYGAMYQHAGFSDPRFAFWDDASWQFRGRETRAQGAPRK